LFSSSANSFPTWFQTMIMLLYYVIEAIVLEWQFNVIQD
jgi:hypothetical protein